MRQEKEPAVSSGVEFQENLGWGKGGPKMRAVYELVGNLGEFLRSRFLDMHMTHEEIAQQISEISDGKVKVSDGTIRYWLHKLGIPPRTSADYWQIPTFRDRIIEAQRNRWRDPEKRKRHLRGFRTREARENKSEAARKAWRERETRERLLVGNKLGRETIKLRKREGVGKQLEALVPQRRTTRGRFLFLLREKGSKEGTALALGISTGLIRTILRETGVEFQPAPNRTRPRIAAENIKIVRLARKRRLIEKLIPNQRRVIQLRYGKRPRTVREIARQLGCSPANAAELEKHGLARLKRALEMLQ